MQLIETNIICNDFHNDENIIFCQIDQIITDFIRISKMNRKIALIVGNGDYTLTNEHMKYCPENVEIIFAQNTISTHPKIIPIPTGVENEFDPSRKGHGCVNIDIFDKKKYLKPHSTDLIRHSDRFYANFSTPSHGCHLYSIFSGYRESIKNICVSSEHIDYETGLSIPNYFEKVISYQSIISPIGNGIECIRTWESMYMNRVPIVVGGLNLHNVILKIYKDLPLVFIEDINLLNNLDFLRKEIDKASIKSKEKLDYNYWKDFMMEKIKDKNI